MLINFTVNETSSLTELDTLLARLSEKTVTHLVVEKSQNDYRFEYVFGTEYLDSSAIANLYDLIFEFRMALLTDRVRDLHIHFDYENSVFIKNSSYMTNGPVGMEDLTKSAGVLLEKAVLLLEPTGLCDEETDLLTTVPNSKKHKKNTVRDAITGIKAAITKTQV